MSHVLGIRRRARLLSGAAGAAARAIRASRGAPGHRAALLQDLSPQLRQFVEELPEERLSLLAFVRSAAADLPEGARLLDAAAGDAPYRELFAHCRYVTADWDRSPHPGAAAADVIGSLAALPIEDEVFDAVLCTQALEHVADPLQTLKELRRVTRPGGHLYLTAPLVWELHEEPDDYYRFTAHGLRHLLTHAGYDVESIEPRNGLFTTLAALSRTSASALWPTEARSHRVDTNDRRRSERIVAYRLLRMLVRILPAFDDLVEDGRLPLGYSCVAVRPDR